MDGIELISFEIISIISTAKNLYMDAIQEAKKGNFESSNQLMAEGDKIFVEGHIVHEKLIQREARGEKLTVNLLLMHAEDQLMTTETLRFFAEELIEVYRRKE